MPAWTNASVRGFSPAEDPVLMMVQRARAIVLDAIERGWSGPPFDPFDLAALLDVKVVPKEDVADARIVPRDGRLEIEFNPNRPRQRVRFSIAHELGHTLFPDCSKVARHRGENHSAGPDAWQLELLCNLAASEFLMPTGDEIDPRAVPTIDYLLDLQSKFDVSAEAIAIRLANLSETPCTVVVAARLDQTDTPKRFRVDYAIPSRSSAMMLHRGSVVKSAFFAECTAVGFTAKGSEKLVAGLPVTYLECVGIPPYPGALYPRVLAIIQGSRSDGQASTAIVHLRGSALEPRGEGTKIIAQLVNDQARSWGGGFAASARDRYPSAHNEFQRWVASSGRNLRLGHLHLSDSVNGVAIASLVAQHGYGPSRLPRIRYAALGSCFDRLATIAIETRASVHMPRIGAGSSGGNWSVVLEMIDDHLARRGVPVSIYSPPGSQTNRRKVLGGTTLRLDAALPDGGTSSG
jgi:IrrE N-terminal-like domain